MRPIVLLLASRALAAQTWFPPQEMMAAGVYNYPEAWPETQRARDIANIKKPGMEFIHMAGSPGRPWNPRRAASTSGGSKRTSISRTSRD